MIENELIEKLIIFNIIFSHKSAKYILLIHIFGMVDIKDIDNKILFVHYFVKIKQINNNCRYDIKIHYFQ